MRKTLMLALAVVMATLAGCPQDTPVGIGDPAGGDSDGSALPAYDQTPWGIAAHLPLPDEVARIETLGFNWARITLNWHLIESERGVYDWDAVDQSVADLGAADVNLMATLYGTPSWASDAGEPNAPPRDPNDWAAFVSAAVTRYRDDIHHWGLWNEPNGGDEDYWTSTPAAFGRDILIPGSRAAKAADPNGYVLGPGVTIHTDWMTWFRECLAGGAADGLDIITVHLYVVGDADDLFFLVDDRAGDLGDQWPLETMLTELGLTDRPCWLEETGWPTGGTYAVSAAEQAARIHDLFWRVYQSDVIEKVFLYELMDDPAADLSAPEGSTNFGLLDPNGDPKPAHATVADFLADPQPPE